MKQSTMLYIYYFTDFRAGNPSYTVITMMFLTAYSVTSTFFYVFSVIRRYNLAKMRRKRVKLCILRLFYKSATSNGIPKRVEL